MQGWARTLLLLLPFGLVTWVHWLQSVQQERKEQVLTSRAPTPKQRDLIMARRARLRWLRKSSSAARAQAQTPPQVATGFAKASLSDFKASVDAVVSDAATGRTASAPEGASECPASRKPYHVLLTATAQVYQQWQCRVMYFHWKKQRDLDPAGKCTEMTGLTRLVATPGGRPDGLEDEVPSIFVKEYDGSMLMRFQGYRVINRPYSVVQLLERRDVWNSIKEEYIYIAETDHILMHALPNKALLGSPMAYVFNYMGPNPSYADIVERVWPEGGSTGYKRVRPAQPPGERFARSACRSPRSCAAAARLSGAVDRPVARRHPPPRSREDRQGVGGDRGRSQDERAGQRRAGLGHRDVGILDRSGEDWAAPPGVCGLPGEPCQPPPQWPPTRRVAPRPRGVALAVGRRLRPHRDPV